MLSKRLCAVAKMVTENNIVADIGTDHGYVPIYLVKNNICPKAYAIDINVGPLKIAEKNIAMEGLQDKITTILSNGMDKLKSYMTDTVIIAGMGGDLIVDILTKGKNIEGIKELVISPHKRADLVRKYLCENNWVIIDEKMIIDSNKFYTIIKAFPGKEDRSYNSAEFKYGKLLLESKDSVLRIYLEKEKKMYEDVLYKMNDKGNEKMKYVWENIELNRQGICYFNE